MRTGYAEGGVPLSFSKKPTPKETAKVAHPGSFARVATERKLLYELADIVRWKKQAWEPHKTVLAEEYKEWGGD